MFSLRVVFLAGLIVLLCAQSLVLFYIALMKDESVACPNLEMDGRHISDAALYGSAAFVGHSFYFNLMRHLECPSLMTQENGGMSYELIDVTPNGSERRVCSVPINIPAGDYTFSDNVQEMPISICDETCRTIKDAICMSGGVCSAPNVVLNVGKTSEKSDCVDTDSNESVSSAIRDYGLFNPKLLKDCFGENGKACISSIDARKTFAGEFIQIRLTNPIDQSSLSCKINGTELHKTYAIQSGTDEMIYTDNTSVLTYDVTFPNMKFKKNNLDAIIIVKCHIPTKTKPKDYPFEVQLTSSNQKYEFEATVCAPGCRAHGNRCKKGAICVCEVGFTSKDCTEEDYQIIDPFQKLLISRSVDKKIIMVFVKHTNLPLAVNLWYQMKALNIHNFIFVASNLYVGKALEKLGISESVYHPQFRIGHPLSRLYFIHSALSWGYSIFVLDGDSFLMKSPWPLIKQYEEKADFVFFSSGPSQSLHCFESLLDEKSLGACNEKVSPSTFYLQHSPSSLQFIRESLKKQNESVNSAINLLEISKTIPNPKIAIYGTDKILDFSIFVQSAPKTGRIKIDSGVIIVESMLHELPSSDHLLASSPRVSYITRAQMWVRRTKFHEDNKILNSISTAVIGQNSFTCPNNCNYKGHCDRGTCFCWGNNRGSDCSEELDSTLVKIGDLEELARERANEYGDLVIITINLGFVHFAVNLINSFQKLNLSNYICIALDKEAAAYIQTQFNSGTFDTTLNDTRPINNVPLYYNEYESSGISVLAFKYMKGEYIDLVNLKVLYTLRLLHNGYNVLVSDGDTYWIRNPMEKMYRDSDLSLTVDGGQYCYGESASPDSNYPSRPGYLKYSGVRHQCIPYLSTGFYFVRSSVGGINLLTELFIRTVVGHGMEQITLNEIMRERRNINWRELPICMFRNGQQSLGRPHNFCVVQHTKCMCDVYVSHINYLTAQLKEDVLTEFNLWDISDARRFHAKNYIRQKQTEGQLAVNRKAEVLCLNDCQGHGGCRNGVCECSREWKGDDCGIRAPDPCSKTAGRRIIDPMTNMTKCECIPPYFGMGCRLRRHWRKGIEWDDNGPLVPAPNSIDRW